MKRFILKHFLAIALMAMSALHAQAQTPTSPPPGTPSITMVVNTNAKVKISMTAANDNDSVWIENGTDIKKVPVSKTKKDTTIIAQGSTIKVHGNSLKEFRCINNITGLTRLAFSSGLTNLIELYCFNNDNLQTLEVSGLTNLKELKCYNNDNLQTLEVSGLTNLKGLYCFNNNLTKLNVSGLTNLIDLVCYNNNLQTLEVSGLTNLTKLWCHKNSFNTKAINDIFCALPQRKTADSAKIYPLFDDTDANAADVKKANANIATGRNWNVLYLYNESAITTTGKYNCNSNSDPTPTPTTPTPTPTDTIPPSGTPYITIAVSENSSIRLSMQAAANNAPIWIETEPNKYTIVTANTDYSNNADYTAEDDTIKVHGNLKDFDCGGNRGALKALSFSDGLTNLETLYCFDNQLTNLNVSSLPKLRKLVCNNNRLTSLNIESLNDLEYIRLSDNYLSACAIDSLFSQLPQKDSKGSAYIYIKGASYSNPGALSCRDTIATNRNWIVMEDDSNPNPVANTTYGCDCITGTYHISPQSLNIYPNPARNAVTVSISESLQGETMQIIDLFGRLVSQQRLNDTSNRIDVSSLCSGMYFVRIGSEVKKLIVK